MKEASQEGASEASHSFQELLSRARGGDREATGMLLQQHRNYLTMVASAEFDQRLTARAGVSDVVQETLLHAQQNLGQFRGQAEAEFRGWLRTILANDLRKTHRTHRTKKRNTQQEISPHDQSTAKRALVDPDITPSRQAVRRERAEYVLRLLNLLPEDYRLVIRYRNFEYLGFDEIGLRMNRSADAARKLWARAIESFRDMLGTDAPSMFESYSDSKNPTAKHD